MGKNLQAIAAEFIRSKTADALLCCFHHTERDLEKL
jgi:hypothetical protein